MPKRKEIYESETRRKEKFVKRIEAKKLMQYFCLNMQNRSETNPILLSFALKRKKIEAKKTSSETGAH
jgi:hypothetical protein